MMVVENQVILVARILTKREKRARLRHKHITYVSCLSLRCCKSKEGDDNTYTTNTLQVLPGDLRRAI
jgi:hypothetical protein